MDPFIESGMTFGPYPDGHCFRVEFSDTYKAVQDGVQIAEFLLLKTEGNKSPTIWIVEAKSSSPRSGTQPRFNEFIAEIRDKMVNALDLGIASILKRHPLASGEMSDHFKTLDLALVRFSLVLIINGHEESWMPPLQDELRRALNATARTWALGANAVVAINHSKARQYGLISAP